MKPIKLYPSRGPVVFRYTAVALLSASLVVQFDWSKKHVILALAWITLLCALVIKDFFDFFVHKRYQVALEISDTSIRISRALSLSGINEVKIQDIEKVTRDYNNRLLQIYLRNGITVSISISMLRSNDVDIALTHINQLVRL